MSKLSSTIEGTIGLVCPLLALMVRKWVLRAESSYTEPHKADSPKFQSTKRLTTSFSWPQTDFHTVAVLRGDSNVKGVVTFEQSSESSHTTISWEITGHDTNAERGMHVHAFGDNTNGCTSAGPHCRSSSFIGSIGKSLTGCDSQSIWQGTRCSVRSEPPCWRLG
jgi:hypothetical protein